MSIGIHVMFLNKLCQKNELKLFNFFIGWLILIILSFSIKNSIRNNTQSKLKIDIIIKLNGISQISCVQMRDKLLQNKF